MQYYINYKTPSDKLIHSIDDGCKLLLRSKLKRIQIYLNDILIRLIKMNEKLKLFPKAYNSSALTVLSLNIRWSLLKP